jgi:hypothetical protein
MKYTIKTRNWNGKKWVKGLLDLAGAYATEDFGDHDVKYWLETTSALVAWMTWAYFMTLRPLSGGWTYIVRPGRELSGGTYVSIY